MQPSNAPEVYFDSNAISNFFATRDGRDSNRLSDVRTALVASVRRQRLRVNASAFQFDELSGIAKRHIGLYWNCRRLLWRTASRRLLLPLDDLFAFEVAHERQAEGRERFCPRAMVRQAREISRSLDAVADIARTQHAESVEFKLTDKQRHAAVRHELGEGASPERFRTWWSESDRLVEQWIRDGLRDKMRSVDTFPVRRLHAMWWFFAFHMARLVRTVGDNEDIKRSDAHDAYHFTMACYGDLMVTDDRGLLETCALIPDTPCQLLRFDEFIDRYLELRA
jgi:hypothetical protein